MAVARSCLTLWVSCIVVPMFLDPPITIPGFSSDDQNQAPVGEGSWISRFGLVPVS
jgi:hypothetical protein